jgi:hypothetical protein
MSRDYRCFELIKKLHQPYRLVWMDIPIHITDQEVIDCGLFDTDGRGTTAIIDLTDDEAVQKAASLTKLRVSERCSHLRFWDGLPPRADRETMEKRIKAIALAAEIWWLYQCHPLTIVGLDDDDEEDGVLQQPKDEDYDSEAVYVDDVWHITEPTIHGIVVPIGYFSREYNWNNTWVRRMLEAMPKFTVSVSLYRCYDARHR